MPIIPIAIKIFQTAFKYRKQIYAVVTAQDRYIKGAFVGTRISKAAQYGWRTGAAAGGLLGSYVNIPAEDTPGNGIQTPNVKRPATSPPNQTRYRQSVRSGNRYTNYCKPYTRRRRSSSR